MLFKFQFRVHSLEADLDPSGNVWDAKKVLSSIVNVPPEFLRIIWKGRERYDEEILALFGMSTPGGRFSLIEKAEHEQMRAAQAQASNPPSPAPSAAVGDPQERAAMGRIDQVLHEARDLTAGVLATEALLRDRAWRTTCERTLLALERLLLKLDGVDLDAFSRESPPRLHRKAAVVTIQDLMKSLDVALAELQATGRG